MHGQQEEFCIANMHGKRKDSCFSCMVKNKTKRTSSALYMHTKLLAFQSHLKCREEEERRIEDERRREQLDSRIVDEARTRGISEQEEKRINSDELEKQEKLMGMIEKSVKWEEKQKGKKELCREEIRRKFNRIRTCRNKAFLDTVIPRKSTISSPFLFPPSPYLSLCLW